MTKNPSVLLRLTRSRVARYLLIGALGACASVIVISGSAPKAAPSLSSYAPVEVSNPSDNSGNDISVDAEGTVHLPPSSAPYSSFVSRQSKTAFFQRLAYTNASAEPDLSIAEQRQALDEYLRPAVKRVHAIYPVVSTPTKLGGVYTDVIVPKDGIPAKNAHRVLINLHAGAFFAGARTMGFLESAPVASIGKIKVVTVDYRQGPEYKFPAASEDVATVYRQLLKDYQPQNIGIYGCSAGGLLTAQVIAWLQKEQLPLPGAIGIFCASAAGWAGGDASHLSQALSGSALPAAALAPPHPEVCNTAYLSDADFSDPLVLPIRSNEVLAHFPPTLIITSTRDVAMSTATYTHTQLVKLGVESDLHVWEGLVHGFFVTDPDVPESKDVWNVVTRFFDKRLSSG